MTAGPERIALFGGSFDPPHQAHLAIAAAAVEHCDLQQVVFIPCQVSPLKGRSPGASGADRLAMLRLATNAMAWAAVSDWELSRPGPSYSWQTAEHLAAAHPGAALYWLMGADQWDALDRWARPDILRERLTFIVFARDGTPPAPQKGWRSIFLPGEFSGSSTEARLLLASGASTAGLLPEEVAEYALRRRLYAPGDP